MVITIEPGIYLPGWGGVRIEDDILVTRTGHQVLSDVAKDLESCLVVVNPADVEPFGVSATLPSCREVSMTDSESQSQEVFEVERIRRLVELMKEHGLSEVDLRDEGQRIRLRRGPEIRFSGGVRCPSRPPHVDACAARRGRSARR